jgi:hypothetical protein
LRWSGSGCSNFTLSEASRSRPWPAMLGFHIEPHIVLFRSTAGSGWQHWSARNGRIVGERRAMLSELKDAIEVNALQELSKAVVEAARASLVIGQA